MKHRRELAISFARSTSREIFDLLDSFLMEGWSRAQDEERKWTPSVNDMAACYRCDARHGRPAARLILNWSGPALLSVGRILPAENPARDSSVAVWNVVVADFHRHCLSAIGAETLERLGLKIGLFSEEISVADLMPPLLFELLETVTPTSREDSWISFYVAAAGTQHRLTSELLALWLMDHRWGVEAAESQARQFDFALRLLACDRSVCANDAVSRG